MSLTLHPTLEKLIEYTIANKSSDLHLSSSHTPFVRIDGDLNPVPDFPPLSEDLMLEIIHSMMFDHQKKNFLETMEADFSVPFKDGSRFRVNAFRTIGGPSAVLRLIPAKTMTLEQIMAPKVLNGLCKLHKGLVLVVGPTGSGKSTTLSAMINNINQNYHRHIITIEDPIEFVYKTEKSLVNQREVGTDTLSFSNALRGALREDPNVILVGEMRDLETIRLALTASETGHLVFATLHTNSASESINRIIDVFPPQDKDLIRSMFSVSLKAVISQRLIKKESGGRCAAFEVMLANNAIRNLIREDKISQINSIIEISKKYGMISMKDSIADLADRKIISVQIANDLIAAL
jgi:twitching motility protein PilT